MANFQILQGQPSFLQGAGIGLSQGLNQLAQQKLQEIQQNNERAQFARLLQQSGRGYNQADADLIAQFQPEKRLEALQSLPARDQFEQQANVTPLGQISQTTNPQATQSAPAFTFPPTDEIIKQAKDVGMNLDPEQEARMRQRLDQIRNDPQALADLQQKYENDIKQNKPIELRQPGYTGPAMPLDQALSAAAGQQANLQPLQAQQQNLGFRKPNQTTRETTQQKEQIKAQIKQDTEYKEELDTTDKTTKEALTNLDKLQKYANDPEFLTGFQYAIAKRVTGLPKANQEFDKLIAAGIIKEAASGQAGRATNQLRDLIQKANPDAYNNDVQGINAIISDMRDATETARIPVDIYRNLQKQYGRLPTGWSDIVKQATSDIPVITSNKDQEELQFALGNPQEYEEGTTWDLGNGRQVVLVNGQWQEQ